MHFTSVSAIITTKLYLATFSYKNKIGILRYCHVLTERKREGGSMRTLDAMALCNGTSNCSACCLIVLELSRKLCGS